MIITDPNKVAAKIHDRMPVVLLSPNQFEPWLSGNAGTEILNPAADGMIVMCPVSKRVNNSRTDDSDSTLIETVAALCECGSDRARQKAQELHIAKIYPDFDDMLAHDTTTSLLLSRGIDVKKFWGEEIQSLMDDGWDPVPAYLYQIIRWSQDQKPQNRITRSTLMEEGKKIEYFPGVPRLFNHLQGFVKKTDPLEKAPLSLESEFLRSRLRGHGNAVV